MQLTVFRLLPLSIPLFYFFLCAQPTDDVDTVWMSARARGIEEWNSVSELLSLLTKLSQL